MAVEKRADAVWHGSLTEGSGSVTAKSGAFAVDVSWPKRSEEGEGATSPEELIAAAHAACFSMALSSGLTKGGQSAARSSGSRRRSASRPGRASRGAASRFAGGCPDSTRRRSSRLRRRPPRTARCRRRSPASRSSTRRSSTGRETHAPGLEWPGDEHDRPAGLGSRTLLRGGAGAHGRPRGLLRSPVRRYGGSSTEGARGAAPAGPGVAGGPRRRRDGP